MKKSSKKKIVFISGDTPEERNIKELTNILCVNIHDYIKETERTMK